MRVLDSHLHLWDPARLDYSWLEGALRARFGPEELDAAVGGIDEARGFLFVQAGSAEDQYLDEVEWVSSLAEQVNVRGIVAGARLDLGEATVQYLDAVAEHPLVVGVRHLLQAAPAGLAGSTEFRAGATALAERGLTFDACVQTVPQLWDVVQLADALPQLRIVLDHIGKPVVGTAADPAVPAAEWADALGALAQHPQVFCKLSGLPAEAGGDWSAGQLEPFLDAAAAAFGAQRLMWGSDWPVSSVGPAGAVDGSVSYQLAGRARWTEAVASWAADRGHDLDAIMWSNAARFYAVA